ncbi:hypothetical protein CO172_02700 [Candidatus Uhrbacteria bacterium CG_4_9_14_3_um_filter_36_7]|uniref:Uncharacterized protein n=1 Tax=Candidatus Uhrbacteria bacterium CG_4_9_14_3_um_filter_36_7 TaxID=1975033 RepID=A0A2M7XH41_9BACT|nr:MAG: hypothetical protein CO172_02700 [Candidatus Uhrbacteria bacterium CG_4_9_14_3_um_filter_36_7]
MLIIPKKPSCLRLPICRLWNGEAASVLSDYALFELWQDDDGLMVRLFLQSIKKDNDFSQEKKKWNGYVFFVEEGGQYLKLEMWCDGICTLRGFDRNNECLVDFKDINLHTSFKSDPNHHLCECLVCIPWEIFPKELISMNAFLEQSEFLFAYHPLSEIPTKTLSQIETFPFVRLDLTT